MSVHLKRDYVCGMNLNNKYIRKYMYTITKGEKEGKIFFSETVTKKKNDLPDGKSKTIYYGNDTTEFDNIKDCINAL